MSTLATITPEDVAADNEKLEDATPQEIIEFAIDKFGAPNTTLACSFGAEDVVLVDMLAKITDSARVFSLDTGFLFWETEETQRKIAGRYDLPFEIIHPERTIMGQAEEFGRQLYLRDPGQCCNLNKVLPLESALDGYDVWITGIRRDQAPTRAESPNFTWDDRFGLYKVNPLVRWTEDDVWAYINENDVIYNPLHDRGYPSVGCAPCTKAVAPGEDPRAGRWAAFEKTECGLHADS